MKDSKIEWTHHTFNPWRGCTKVSAGCANCYAETLSHRNPKTLGVWGPNGTRVVASESMWKEPLKWNQAAKVAGERHRVFCASLADVFEDWKRQMVDSQGFEQWHDVNDKWTGHDCSTGRPVMMADVRRRLFELIDATPQLDWLLLTKRPENVLPMLDEISNGEGDTWNLRDHMPNVWLGTSVENQQAADERIPHLLKVPATVRFLSMEPLLGPVEFSDVTRRSDAVKQLGKKALDGIHWVIVGGESGPDARPMHPAWAKSIRDQCTAVGVAFHFKQWGEWRPPVVGEEFNTAYGNAGKPPAFLQDYRDGTVHCFYPVMGLPEEIETTAFAPLLRVGKKAAGRLLDGREWNELPNTEVKSS